MKLHLLVFSQVFYQRHVYQEERCCALVVQPLCLLQCTLLFVAGEDGTFNLLEYAGELALDPAALDDEEDKSIFDEHLGIKDAPPALSTAASRVRAASFVVIAQGFSV